MDNYNIVTAGIGFRVTQTSPDGRDTSVGGFPTEAAARTWLDSFKVLLGLIDCMSGKTSLH